MYWFAGARLGHQALAAGEGLQGRSPPQRSPRQPDSHVQPCSASSGHGTQHHNVLAVVSLCALPVSHAPVSRARLYIVVLHARCHGRARAESPRWSLARGGLPLWYACFLAGLASTSWSRCSQYATDGLTPSPPVVVVVWHRPTLVCLHPAAQPGVRTLPTRFNEPGAPSGDRSLHKHRVGRRRPK